MLCNKCKQDKPPEEFHLRAAASSRKAQSWCKECRRSYDRQYHKQRYASGKKTRQFVANRERNRRFVWEYLCANPCVECGESDPVVLEFNHLRDKETDVSLAISGAWSLKRLANEIAKCEVLCANCHRRKTAEQFGYWVLKYEYTGT